MYEHTVNLYNVVCDKERQIIEKCIENKNGKKQQIKEDSRPLVTEYNLLKNSLYRYIKKYEKYFKET